MTYLEALQTTLAAEHAAVYVLGALGARISQSAEPVLFAAVTLSYRDHRSRRDQVVAMVRDEGAEPVAAEAAYALPVDLETGDQGDAVTRSALALERAAASSYAYLVANSPSAVRRWPITALNMTAVRELAFRGTPEMFPGSDEYADR